MDIQAKNNTMNYRKPDKLENALSLLASGNWTILSGGTDFYPAVGNKAVSGAILDISALSGLRTITQKEDFWHVGATATWSDVIAAQLPPAFDGLKLAGREIGSVQIQNRATVVGNICNASPAGDGVPPLLTLECIVRLESVSGRREIPLLKFVLGNRCTALEPGEMVTALLIPKSAAKGSSSFIKLGIRKYLIISIAMAAARLVCDQQGRIIEAAISVGACSVIARRLPELEQMLIKLNVAEDLASAVKLDHFLQLSPIDDIRAPAAYRLSASIELVKMAINAAAIGV